MNNLVIFANSPRAPLTNRFGVARGGVQQHSVAEQEVFEGVADREARLPDAHGVHHARVAQLHHAQLSVESLEERVSG